MKRSGLFIVLFCCIFPDYLFSIPAFARKYQISCQVCHSPVMPRLKAFGDDFAGAGFRMTDYESPRYFVPTGDEELSLFRELPLAIRIDGFASVNFNKNKSLDFASPYVLKILSGGELSEKLSYYFYFLLNERGSVAGVEDAFLMYSDLLGTGINFYLGQFQASDPLYKSELRYTLEPYVIYDARPRGSSIALKYERGIILEKGFESGTTVVGEVVNGNGIGEAGEGHVFDSDGYKNFMLRLTQDISAVSIGVFGYFGKEIFPGANNNEVLMWGPDLAVDLNERFILNLQYLRRNDLYAWNGPLLEKDIFTHGGFAEIIYSPKGDMSKWYLTGLFNLIESDYDPIDYQSATFHAGYILRRNVRLVSEYTYQFNDTSYGKFNFGFVSAF